MRKNGLMGYNPKIPSSIRRITFPSSKSRNPTQRISYLAAKNQITHVWFAFLEQKPNVYMCSERFWSKRLKTT